MKLLGKLAGGMNRSARNENGNATTGWLKTIDHCPHCEQSMTGHSHSLLASDLIDRNQSDRLNQFFESLKSRDWRKLLTFQQWEGLSDNVESHGIRCGSDSVVLVAVRSPFELYDNDEVLAIEVLDEKESRELLKLINPENWKAID